MKKGPSKSGYTDNNWFKRRFYDFRNGHTIYLAFTMNFVQFIIIFYSLAIERFNFLQVLFPEIWQWVVFFLAIYVPAAVVIGRWHITNQWRAEVKQSTLNNPYSYYTTEGKEQLYNLPSALADFNFKMRAMTQGNALADAVETIAKNMNIKLDKPIPRFTNQELDPIAYCTFLAQGLKDGKNIMDLVTNDDAKSKPEVTVIAPTVEKQASKN